MISGTQIREVFHFSFFERLLKLTSLDAYILKGGVNLRFFFNSPRYSEDMGIDVPAGSVETHKKNGADWSESHLPYRIATPEKALIDTLYLSTRKNRRFAALPEVDVMTSGFRIRKFEQTLKSLPIPARVLSAIQQ